jgi:acetylornithine deacetylase
LINGEPTSNLLALVSKGTLRLELEAKGKAAHSAYPELGESAIEKLLDNLNSLRRSEWPSDPTLGETTLNIGVISGGPAANIISDHAAASVVIRVVSDLEELKKIALAALDERVNVTVTTETPAIRLQAVEGFETCVVKYTTDIPKLTRWGRPLLLGPGTIHVAHTLEERVPKQEVADAVGLYANLVKQLQTTKTDG